MARLSKQLVGLIAFSVGCVVLPWSVNATTIIDKTEQNQKAERRIVKKKGDGGGFFDRLKAGGLVILMRHANSPSNQVHSVALGNNCELAPGRGLDTKGILQASLVRDFLAEEEIPVAQTFSSYLCRTMDTARLVVPSIKIEKATGLASTDPEVIADFKLSVEAVLSESSSNVLLVSHSNIVPFYGAKAGVDEEEVPSGSVFIIDPAHWEAIARIDMETSLEVKMKVRVSK